MGDPGLLGFSKKANGGSLTVYKRFLKRVFDIVISLLLLPFFALLLIIFAPIIFLTDRGPVFYASERIGRNGKLFKMIKFRSMYVDAPDIRLADGSTFNGEDDPRVTKIGKFLRASSLDEIPQVLNVLAGQMSLIGPRPDPPDCLDRYPEDVRVFLNVRPGITGYNQAYFRNSSDGTEKMKNDVYYATHCTFGLDLRITFKTLAVVFVHENVYRNIENEKEAIRQAELYSMTKKDSDN